MKRIAESESMYHKEIDVMIDGKRKKATFRVFKVQDSMNNLLPFWGWDCPSIGLVTRDVFETKREAIEHMEESIKIGFKTLPIKSVTLDLTPLK